jgi:hypothetical protein
MVKVKQPNPISEGWDAYRKLVDEELKKKSKHIRWSVGHI